MEKDFDSNRSIHRKIVLRKRISKIYQRDSKSNFKIEPHKTNIQSPNKIETNAMGFEDDRNNKMKKKIFLTDYTDKNKIKRETFSSFFYHANPSKSDSESFTRMAEKAKKKSPILMSKSMMRKKTKLVQYQSFPKNHESNGLTSKHILSPTKHRLVKFSLSSYQRLHSKKKRSRKMEVFGKGKEEIEDEDFFKLMQSKLSPKRITKNNFAIQQKSRKKHLIKLKKRDFSITSINHEVDRLISPPKLTSKSIKKHSSEHQNIQIDGSHHLNKNKKEKISLNLKIQSYPTNIQQSSQLGREEEVLFEDELVFNHYDFNSGEYERPNLDSISTAEDLKTDPSLAILISVEIQKKINKIIDKIIKKRINL